MHTLNKHKEGIYAVALDNINIVYSMDDVKKEVVILKLMYVDASLPREKLRTKEWLAAVTDMIDFETPPTSDIAQEIISCESPLEETKQSEPASGHDVTIEETKE